MDSASIRQYKVFCRLNPNFFNSSSLYNRKDEGVTSLDAVFSLLNAAAAEASETCCSSIIWTSVAKPG
jgi:hypothetical protein